MKILTSDLCDGHPEVGVADPGFSDFGGVDTFHGRVVALKVFEDNALIRAVLEEPGEGHVLIVDGGGSMRCALVGGNLAQLAAANGWQGIIVFGCVRDAEEIRRVPVGVKALATHPRRSEKGLHSGQRHRSVSFAGLCFKDGQWVYADADGIVLSSVPLHGPV